MRLAPFGLLALLGILYAQTPTLEFEVATVKRSGPRRPGVLEGTVLGGPGTNNPVLLSVTRGTLLRILSYAYGGLRADQISGPSWLSEENYDFAMRVPPGTSKEQSLVMLQNLLADRFSLTLHHVMKEFPVYHLVIGKNGSKLRKTALPNAKDSKIGDRRMPLDRNGFPQLPPGVGGVIGVAANGLDRRTYVSVAVKQLLPLLERQISGDRAAASSRVVDDTGLTGKYDFHLEFAGVLTGTDPGSGPSIFDALENQLGLRLDKSKELLDTIVIDHAEKVPKDN